MRIKRVVSWDFRKAPINIWDDWLASLEGHESLSMEKDEVVVFVSKKGNQLLFLHGLDLVDDRTVMESRRLRLATGTWSPYMLVNYAEQVGLKITGLKRFEDYFKKR